MNLLTYIVYALLAVLVIWGLKFPGFKNKFNDDFLDINSTKAVCGLAAILVILHHISQKPAFQDVTKELFFFNDIGFLVVSIFFFCSGYGLTISADNNPDYLKTFARKRLLTVLVPFYVFNIIFAIYQFNNMPLIRIVLGTLGFVLINPNGWFPFVLLVFYGVFYFSRKHIKTKKCQLVSYLIVSLLLILLFCVNGHFAWWADSHKGWWLVKGFNNVPWWMQEQVLLFSGEWWVNSSIAFFVGAVFASYKDIIVNFFKKGYWLKEALLIILFFVSYFYFRNLRDFKYNCWTEYYNFDPGITDKIICTYTNSLVSFIFIIAFVVLLMKFRSDNPITRFMGKISYETYLIGVIPLETLLFIISKNENPIVRTPYNYNLAIYVVAVISETILLGFLFNKLDNYIVRKINKEKVNEKY